MIRHDPILGSGSGFFFVGRANSTPLHFFAV
jgi:hypothetical protein